MITTLVFDFSRVLLFPKDQSYIGGLNNLHKELASQQNYKLLDNFSLNVELLEYLKTLRPAYTLYLYTSEIIQDSPEVRPELNRVLDQIYSAMNLGISKKEARGYELLAKEIGRPPSEILFIDDTIDNIEAARQAGYYTILYRDNKSLFADLEKMRVFANS